MTITTTEPLTPGALITSLATVTSTVSFPDLASSSHLPTDESGRPRFDVWTRELIQLYIDQNVAVRADLREQWTTLLDDTLLQQDTARDEALNAYLLHNLNRTDSRERVQHFLHIISWYNRREQMFDGRIRNCRSAIDKVEQEWINLDRSLANKVVQEGTKRL
jgi:hypothetical protein